MSELGGNELLVTALVLVLVGVPMYIAWMFARRSGRQVLPWVLLGFFAGILVLPIILLTMMFGKKPFADGVPRSRDQERLP
jgi:hypothetical protein